MLLFAVAASANAQTEQELKRAAQGGDYQAQRNLAYSYAAGWGKPGDPRHVARDPVAACAWYRVVLITNPRKIHDGDTSNEWTYCNKLSIEDHGKAWRQALDAAAAIDGRRPGGRAQPKD